MTDRTPDRDAAPDHGETTVRLDRRLAEPAAATPAGGGSPRDEIRPTPADVRPAAEPSAPEPGSVSDDDAAPTTRVTPEAGAEPPAPSAAGPTPVADRDPAGRGAPAPARDDRTVDLSKRDTERVHRELPSSWDAVAAAPAPSTPYGPAPAGPAGHWSAQPPPQAPPSWSPPQPPPPWAGGTRAMPNPAAAPPLPAPRGRGVGPVVVFGILAALVMAAGAWALITLVSGAAPFGSRGTEDPSAGAPITSAAPDPSAPILPLPPTGGPDTGSPDDPVPTDGPSGQVLVNWTIAGTGYQATVTTVGSTGTAEVTYTSDGQENTVRQDLTLASADGRRAYVGSNPVRADTGAPTSDYSPDVFMLATTAEGKVYIDEVCDTTGICAPATMQ